MNTIIKKRFTKNVKGVITSVDLFDKLGNRIYRKKLDGFEEDWLYNNKGLLRYYSNSDGNDIMYEYEDNNIIRCKTADDDEFIIYTKHDQKGNEIYSYNTKTELKIWKDYNNDNKLVRYRDSNGITELHEYDCVGNEVYMKRNIPDINSYYEYFKMYDFYNHEIEFKDSNGNMEYYEYEFYD